MAGTPCGGLHLVGKAPVARKPLRGGKAPPTRTIRLKNTTKRIQNKTDASPSRSIPRLAAAPGTVNARPSVEAVGSASNVRDLRELARSYGVEFQTVVTRDRPRLAKALQLESRTVAVCGFTLAAVPAIWFVRWLLFRRRRRVSRWGGSVAVDVGTPDAPRTIVLRGVVGGQPDIADLFPDVTYHVNEELLAHLQVAATFVPRDDMLLGFLKAKALRWQRELGVPDVTFVKFYATTLALAMQLGVQESLALGTMSAPSARAALAVNPKSPGLLRRWAETYRSIIDGGGSTGTALQACRYELDKGGGSLLGS